MIIYAHKTKMPYLLFIDIEFDQSTLVQFAGLLFKSIGDGVYQLARSCNKYVKHKPSYPFTQYTGLNAQFLNEYGESLQEVQDDIQQVFLDGIDLNEVAVISHGLKNDRLILKSNGIDLLTSDRGLIRGYCTFSNAKRVLRRHTNLKLSDLCLEFGYSLNGAHSAFNDVWGTVAVYTCLKKLEGENDE